MRLAPVAVALTLETAFGRPYGVTATDLELCSELPLRLLAATPKV